MAAKVTTVKARTRIDVLQTVIVKPPCENPKNGFWYCVTHQMAFLNQLQKDSHISTKSHLLAWVCNEHGYESPDKSEGESK